MRTDKIFKSFIKDKRFQNVPQNELNISVILKIWHYIFLFDISASLSDHKDEFWIFLLTGLKREGGNC